MLYLKRSTGNVNNGNRLYDPDWDRGFGVYGSWIVLLVISFPLHFTLDALINERCALVL